MKKFKVTTYLSIICILFDLLFSVHIVKAADIYEPFLSQTDIKDTITKDGVVYEKVGEPTAETKLATIEVEIFRPGAAVYIGAWNPTTRKIAAPLTTESWHYNCIRYINPMKGDGSDFFNTIFKPNSAILKGDTTVAGTTKTIQDFLDLNTVKVKTGATFTSDATVSSVTVNNSDFESKLNYYVEFNNIVVKLSAYLI